MESMGTGYGPEQAEKQHGMPDRGGQKARNIEPYFHWKRSKEMRSSYENVVNA